MSKGEACREREREGGWAGVGKIFIKGAEERLISRVHQG